MLIRSDKLNDRQRSIVLNTFIYRWTFENARKSYYGKCPACVQNPTMSHDQHKPLQTDEQWLQDHAFHFVKDGSRLSSNHKHSVPSFMID